MLGLMTDIENVYDKLSTPKDFTVLLFMSNEMI